MSQRSKPPFQVTVGICFFILCQVFLIGVIGYGLYTTQDLDTQILFVGLAGAKLYLISTSLRILFKLHNIQGLRYAFS